MPALTPRQAALIRAAEAGQRGGLRARGRVTVNNYTIGEATSAEADAIGRAWVSSEGRTSYQEITARDGTRILISDDRLRQYRLQWKAGDRVLRANLESRPRPQGMWVDNAHVEIIYGPEVP